MCQTSCQHCRGASMFLCKSHLTKLLSGQWGLSSPGSSHPSWERKVALNGSGATKWAARVTTQSEQQRGHCGEVDKLKPLPPPGPLGKARVCVSTRCTHTHTHCRSASCCHVRGEGWLWNGGGGAKHADTQTQWKYLVCRRDLGFGCGRVVKHPFVFSLTLQSPSGCAEGWLSRVCTRFVNTSQDGKVCLCVNLQNKCKTEARITTPWREVPVYFRMFSSHLSHKALHGGALLIITKSLCSLCLLGKFIWAGSCCGGGTGALL